MYCKSRPRSRRDDDMEIDHFGQQSREIQRAMKSKSKPMMNFEIPENLYELIEGFDLDEQAIGLVDYLGSLTII